jgi:hypothetical protein
MPYPTCYTSSSIGPAPGLPQNFLEREETVSITWDDGFNFSDDAYFKVFHQCEPPAVLNIIDILIRNHKFYDLILAYDERVLRECPNARFLTESACSWIGRKSGNAKAHFSPEFYPSVAEYTPCDINKKQFGVSFLTSSKGWLPGHQLRQQIFDQLASFRSKESYEDLNVWKHKSPPRIDDKKSTLEPYQYSVVVENCQNTGYYTEKIVDCFIAKTFPIYWGCPNLKDYFNPEGFLMFENLGHLWERLHSIHPKMYAQRIEAIEENYQIALKSVHQWDLIEQYITEGIHNKKTGKSEPTSQVITETPYMEQKRNVVSAYRAANLRRPLLS